MPVAQLWQSKMFLDIAECPQESATVLDYFLGGTMRLVLTNGMCVEMRGS